MLNGWQAFDELAKKFAAGEACLRVAGLANSARALVTAELLAGTGRPALVIVAGRADAHRWSQDLKFFGANVAEFPEEEPLLWRGGQQREAEAERAVICRRLLAGEPLVIVATPAALALPLPPPAEFRDKTVTLTAGDRLDRELLIEALALGGYERVDSVGGVGQWAARGGIVDIFSPAQATPARVEFFGDEIESIRLFDPTSQRSTGALEELVVLPVEPSTPRDARLSTYLAAMAPVIVDAPRLLEEPVAEGGPRLHTVIEGRQRIELATVAGTARTRDGELALDAHAVTGYAGKLAQLCAELERWRQEGFRVRLVAGDARQGDQLHDILREHGLEAVRADSQSPEGGLHVRPEAGGLGGRPEPPMVIVGECSSGFSIPALGLVVLTEHEIFGARRRSLRRPKYQRGAPLTAFTDLEVNDLVVHEDHGIGRYLGLKTMKVGDKEADFLLLEYSEGNQLYLPVERLELISKYLGGEESAARLDRLGGAAWQRVKESVRAALREMAEELLKLYAQRAVAEGHAFAPDTPWQREFEAAFRFEETPDQLRAIKDVKGDMLNERPMDRLVAGDVGYGKTEVALRAAFKAVADGRQVAVLVPTTVLAHQHWSTFVDRFSPFPARVELLSRFRSPKEQKAVVEGLKQGTVDVVIGTHRLLSKDVAFKDLGLLVVDEEHRFGVAHKERMKQLRTSVDVLALTATPIPRTLYMSLSGVRDMSVIETPPIDRLPIETVVRRFSKSVIKEALTRELERGGQIFFVHNRIQSLASMANLIQSMVPEARVVIGHGQMKERELEATMVKFVTGQADVLVSTAIVESGLDIPASNTIIVNRADRFGLAQLYQLRGRVGRERQQAYCYLLVPADGRVDEQAQKRLRVLQELTELGSGFKLAMRDLEIRGAGNLLGAQQHGHIAAVGYDLYSKLLAEAVRELSGQPSTAAVDPVISAPAEGFLPEEYVPEVNQRLALYKRLAGAGDEETVADIRTELADRFGPPPREVEQLLDVVRIRLVARRLGIEKVEIGDARALLTFAPSTPVEPGKLLAAIRDSKGRLKMKRDYTLEAIVARGEWPRVRDSVHAVLEALSPVRRGLAITPVIFAVAFGGCTIPQWNPAWVPAWVPLLGADRGTPPPARPAAPPRVAERAPVRPDDDEVMERVIAVVNNDAITLGELQEAMAAARADARQRPPGSDEQVRREFLNRFIETRLQLQEADRERIVVDEAEIEEELIERIKKTTMKDVDEFKAALKSQGISYESVRKRLRESLKMAKVVRRKVTIRVSVTDPEIERYLEENRTKLETGLSYHARHILVVPEGGASDATWEAARIRAEVVRSQLKEGVDFAELARKFSADATAKDGGDLGTLKRGELSQEIEARILTLDPGQVSDPYRSDLGYHIFRLESKDGLEGEGLVRARQQIREILFRQKYEARLDAWLREIRERAIIEVRM